MTTSPAARGGQKRALELHEDDEPTFVAGANGAYTNAEMPKRINCGYMVGETSARMRAFDAEDERVTALLVRLKSEVNAVLRNMEAEAAAAAAHPPPHPS